MFYKRLRHPQHRRWALNPQSPAVLQAAGFLPDLRRAGMNWHRWFAWYPVTLRNGHFVWLRYVERKWDNGDATGEPHWRYRRRSTFNQ